MKRIFYIILSFVVTALPGLPLWAQSVSQRSAQVGYENVRIERSGKYIEVSFEVEATAKSVRRNAQLVLTPVLYNKSRKVALPSVAVQSRRVQLQEFRAGKDPDSPDAPAYVIPNKGKLQYHVQLPDTAQLENVFLRIDRKLVSCCCDETYQMPSTVLTDRPSLIPVPPPYVPEVRPLAAYPLPMPTTSEADALSKKYAFVASMQAYEMSKKAPEKKLFDPDMPLNMGKGKSEGAQRTVERFIERNEQGAIQINFERNSTGISRYYRENNNALVVLASVLKKIQGSSDSRVEKIIIAGFASPEGLLYYNDRLAWGRAEAVREFVLNNSNLTSTKIQLYNGSEDWRGLRKLIVESDIKYKTRLLDIIDNVSILSGREKLLMDVGGGEPYRYMSRYFFPKLRNAAYIKVYYADTPAVETINNNLREAVVLMQKGKYKPALAQLAVEQALPGGEVENMMGVCAIQLREFDRAQEYLRKAADKGCTAATVNLKSITPP